MKILTRAAAIVAVGISLCLTPSLKGQQPRKVDEKSGLPSAIRGAGADIFTLPSALRGTPAVG